MASSSDRLPEGLAALDLEGRRVSLNELAQQAPVVLSFLRHFG
jgi:hypothetical protein